MAVVLPVSSSKTRWIIDHRTWRSPPLSTSFIFTWLLVHCGPKARGCSGTGGLGTDHQVLLVFWRSLSLAVSSLPETPGFLEFSLRCDPPARLGRIAD